VARGHLLARIFGGPGDDFRNIIPLFRSANLSMRRIERSIADVLSGGRARWVYYRVVPVRHVFDPWPRGIEMEAVAVNDVGEILFTIAHETVLNTLRP
jgi:DNA/RNA non-specific endonuclease